MTILFGPFRRAQARPTVVARTAELLWRDPGWSRKGGATILAQIRRCDLYGLRLRDSSLRASSEGTR
jgi:hypothetical protein